MGYVAPAEKGILFLGEGGILVNLTEDTIELRKLYGKPLEFQHFSGIVSKNRYVMSLYGADRLGLIMNLRNLAVTQQDVYLFESMTELKDTEYGCNADGLFSFANPGDVAVSAEFSIMYNAPHWARMRKVYLEGEFAGDMKLTLTSDQNTSVAYSSLTPLLTGNKSHRYKIPVHRANGIGKYWTIKVENESGIDFSVDAIEAMPVYRERSK
jgi:hypothetical protein